MKRTCLLVAAGGTGGHLYPAIAVAERFRAAARGAAVVFVGTKRGLESRIVPKAGYSLELVRATPLRGGSIAAKLRGLFGLATGLFDAFRVLGRVKPTVVFGVGAYVSGTVLLAASLRGLPTLLLEPNAEPGLANRWLAPFVDEAACAWEETTAYFGSKGVVTGNPVREEIAAVPPLEHQSSERLRVLVFGGSQGSVVLNRAMTASLATLEPLLERFSITHQTGSADHAFVEEAYRAAAVSARVVPYIDDMAGAYREADLVVARAGATTCAELAASGRGAVLVPLPIAGGHQERNAEMMARAGAARWIRESELTGARLGAELESLLEAPREREAMAAAARKLARADAAETVAARLLALEREALS